MTTTSALLAAAAGVGFGHAILPDHWVPLAVIARTQRHPLSRVARLSALAGVTHVALSLLLGAILIGVGLQFRPAIQHHQDLIVGGILVATGAALLVLHLLDRGHGHTHGEGTGHGHGGVATPVGHEAAVRTRSRARQLAAFVVPFGAAASPDLTILPVFLAAAAAGTAASLATLSIFSMVTVATFVGLTLAGAAGGHLIRGRWIDQAANVITAGMLLVIGALVATGLV
jgi:hypothetical protein